MVSCRPWANDARGLVGGRELEPRPEVEKDVGDMRDDHVAVAQERRREWRERRGPPVEHRGQSGDAAPGPRSRATSTYGAAGRLERQPHELAAPLDAWPIEELIRHRVLSRSPVRLTSPAACGRRL